MRIGVRKRRDLAAPIASLALLLLIPAMNPAASASTQRTLSAAPAAVTVSSTSWHLARLQGLRTGSSLYFTLDAVSCPSPTYCLVVGTESNNSNWQQSVVERFDGKRWRRLYVGRLGDTPNKVACAAAFECAIVGADAKGQPLVELERGGRWHRVVLAHSDLPLDAVACPRVGTCLVEGETASFNARLFSWELHGGRWQPIPFTVHPPKFALVINFSDMSCVSPTDCELVGGYSAGGPASDGLVLRYDGRSWSTDEIQSLADARGRFGNVSCQSHGLCVAAEDLSWPSEADGGLAGIVLQRRSVQGWRFIGRGLPRDDQLIVAEGGVQCFAAGWCLATAGSDTGMFVGAVVGGSLSPLQVVRGVSLRGDNPWLDGLSCAGASLCVEGSESNGTPFVLVGDARTDAPG
jgi:hypothetical protein